MKEPHRLILKARYTKETQRFYRFDLGKNKNADNYRGQIFLRKDQLIPEELVLVLDGANKLKPKKITEEEYP